MQRLLLFLLGFLLMFPACRKHAPLEPERLSGAAQSLDFWALARSYPHGHIYSKNLTQAYEWRKMTTAVRSGGIEADWEPLGPKNIGGRTLCLAFHPDDPEVIFAGSASGGLWKTETGGVGAEAWSYVPTGFPVLGVGAIAIDPAHPEVLYIGTGEVYNYTAAMPGLVDRLTRGTYGIGILKSTDGGQSWSKSLDWSYEEMTGVQQIVVNPLRPETVYAATTEGLFRSYNAGESWDLIHALPMAADFALNPVDTNRMLVSHGGYQSPQKGVFRSIDGGANFSLVSGLPSNYSGKTLLTMSPSDPSIIYASVAHHNAGLGLYRSANGGTTFSLVNPMNVPQYQGWYSHDIAVNPEDPNYLLYTGIDAFWSANAGAILLPSSYWFQWYIDTLIQAGEPEGPSDYVHADIHAAYYHPTLPNTLYLATDGGIFYSGDNGHSWEGRNGGYQTTQFHANFSNSTDDPAFALGGLQDNATAVYLGQDSWYRVIGGDGMSTAVFPDNDSIVFATYQGLNILRSTDRGIQFVNVSPSQALTEPRAFNAPYELAPSQPGTIYAGAQSLYRSVDTANTWQLVGAGQVDPPNVLLTIAVGPDDPQLLYVSTAPLFGTVPPKVLKSVDGGQQWTAMAGLPDRLAMDIAIHPLDPEVVYAVFSGFGTAHVYRTTDGGGVWTPVDGGLPDVPANTIWIDPQIPQHVYMGNDLGVWVSTDGGENWGSYGEGLPEAVLAMHLSAYLPDRKLRLATHGHGVYQSQLLEEVTAGKEAADRRPGSLRLWPNPAADRLQVEVEAAERKEIDWYIVGSEGRLLKRGKESGRQSWQIDLREIPAGVYFLRVQARDWQESRPFIVQ
ncbi:MAG: T9SS type A sorting domain-containing protein [Saprospiraceae bacterium]|nr:T9SS type A sorting domain-containing protein [Saprospiraceae bacterium]MCB0679868.1 T9SS type A sorting domain-containing protein [Saprospiraceae bacterium]